MIHCSNEGLARATLLHLASEMLIIARRINIEGGRLIDAGEIETAADCWIIYQRRHHRISGSRFSRERFIQTATAWLRFLGQLQPLIEKPLAYADLIEEFARYMREERGLSLRTIRSRCWHAHVF